jgi:hypothetical protein
MPDISMCPGINCVIQLTCWRFIAQPSERQTYFTETPEFENDEDNKSNDCSYWMGNRDGREEE